MAETDLLILFMEAPAASGGDLPEPAARLREEPGVISLYRPRAGKGRLLRVHYDPARTSLRRLRKRVEGAGWRATFIGL